MSIHDLLPHLDGVRQTGVGRWIAKCPGHDDRSPSLSLRECDDGRVLIHCFAGCEVESVLAAAGLRFSDLYPDKPLGQRLRPVGHNPRDLLRLVRRESLIVLLAAEDLSRSKALSKADHDRLVAAAGRIARVANEAR